MKNLAVFVSGSGSNLQAIIDAIDRGFIKAGLALVVSDNEKAYALERARKNNIDTFCFNPKKYKNRSAYENLIMAELSKRKIDFIALAGFMRILSPEFVAEYKNRIVNIHPALLPSFPGQRALKDALNYGVKYTGVTVHFVDEGVDSGPIIMQDIEPIKNGDREDRLLERIHKIEHRLYPEAIKLLVEGRLIIEGRRVIVKEGKSEDKKD
ncbi:MAG TPA: phosphoribosylglycinamide formyltransferase [Candidatus Omnitrophica bacterium]|nr:phosphoribosylglycinamide formyltransferase [Candidatus Omnitrophota bacterium]